MKEEASTVGSSIYFQKFTMEIPASESHRKSRIHFLTDRNLVPLEIPSDWDIAGRYNTDLMGKKKPKHLKRELDTQQNAQFIDRQWITP